MFVTVNGQRLFFDVVGEKLAIDGPRMREKPTLIVMHGGPGFDHTSNRPEFDQFADIAQVVYFDHRGNGRSWPSPKNTWTLAQWGDDVKALCDVLGIEKPIVFGQSFGGMVAQSYATRHPDHPRAVIFSSTAARMDMPASLDIFERKGGPDARAIAHRFWNEGTDEQFDEYMKKVMPLYNTTSRAGGEDARGRAIMRREVYRHFSLPGGELLAMDFRAALAKVTCPAMILAGSEDPITPPHLATEIASSLPPGARLEIFDRCGHGAFRDDPARVFPVMRAFIVEQPS
ncbi:MAG: alpha/beta fold hydrolase [Alphaproteobacteria bacterium]|nr:alpha/beta fold hydrolase [Alphaproteobacteria bacterium]